MSGFSTISDAIIVVVTLVVLIWVAIIIYICCVCCHKYKEKRILHDPFSWMKSTFPMHLLPMIMGNRAEPPINRPSNQSVLSLYNEPEFSYVNENQAAFIIEMFGTKQCIDLPPEYDSLGYNTLPTYDEAIHRLKLDLRDQINNSERDK